MQFGTGFDCTVVIVCNIKRCENDGHITMQLGHIIGSSSRNATGNINQYINLRSKPSTGMDGQFIKQDIMSFFSTAQQYGRYGLVNSESWDMESITQILMDQA